MFIFLLTKFKRIVMAQEQVVEDVTGFLFQERKETLAGFAVETGHLVLAAMESPTLEKNLTTVAFVEAMEIAAVDVTEW